MPLACTDIESLAQTYLDDELAEGDSRELELHVAGCDQCRHQLAEEARVRTNLRKQLAPPKPPAALREQIKLALDREDWTAQRASGSRWSRALPAASMLAAAAALLLFVLPGQEPSGPEPAKEPPVAYDAVRQHVRRPPVEVQGAAVSPWIRRHFSPAVQVPRLDQRHTNLRGARLSHLRGRDAVQFYYDVSQGPDRREVSMLLFDASDIDFGNNFRPDQRHRIGNRELWMDDSLGYSVVAHKSADGMGYLFISDMSGKQLLELVRSSDLFAHIGSGR